jgi:hypothetical protein
MEKIAKKLGLKLNESFFINGINDKTFKIDNNGLHYKSRENVSKCNIWLSSDEMPKLLSELLFKEKEVIKIILLSDVEKILLENIKGEFKKYVWLARDGNKELYLYINSPKRQTFVYDEDDPVIEDENFYYWDDSLSGIKISLYEHLFQFIQWEDEPINTTEILKYQNEFNKGDE